VAVTLFSKTNLGGRALSFLLEKEMCKGMHFFFLETKNVRGYALYFF
jgi:hypothetical protein